MYAFAFARFVFVVELGAFFQQHIAHDGSNTLVQLTLRKFACV